MEFYRLSTVVHYDVSVNPLHESSLSLSSLPSSSPSPSKVFFLFARDDGSDYTVDISSATFDACFLDTYSYEFYKAVFRSMEGFGVETEDIHDLVEEILFAAEELSETIPENNFTELWVTVYAKITDLISPFDASTEAEIAMRASMEDYAEANNGMVPMNEKAKETLLKPIVVIGEEDSGRQTEGKDSSDCMICLEGIPVGSGATQVPCSHVFHSSCLEEWLRVSHFCPLCRFEFPAQHQES